MLLAILVSILIPFVSATTYITFSPLNLESEDLLVHNSSGALIGRYNTSSAAIPLTDNESYVFLVVPSNSNLAGNHPDTWFSNLLDYANQHSVALVIIFFLIAVILAAIRRR